MPKEEFWSQIILIGAAVNDTLSQGSTEVHILFSSDGQDYEGYDFLTVINDQTAYLNLDVHIKASIVRFKPFSYSTYPCFKFEAIYSSLFNFL